MVGVELGHEMGEVGGGVDVLVGGGEEGGGGLGGEVHDGEQKGGVVALDLFLDLFELLEALLGFGSEEELLSVFDAVLSDIFTLIWGVNRGDVAENPFQFVLLNPLVLQHQLVQPPICLFHNLIFCKILCCDLRHHKFRRIPIQWIHPVHKYSIFMEK